MFKSRLSILSLGIVLFFLQFFHCLILDNEILMNCFLASKIKAEESAENPYDCPIDWSKGKKANAGKSGTKGKQIDENGEEMQSEGRSDLATHFAKL